LSFTAVQLPEKWAGSQELWRSISGLTVTGAKGVVGNGMVRTIRHDPNRRLAVRYSVASSYSDDPGVDYEKARPIVRPGWFFFHGEGVFAVPEGRADAPARFRWGRLPAGWKVATDLDQLAGKRGTVADISESVAIGGNDLTVISRNVRGAPLRLAIRGKWSFEPTELADLIEKIVEAEQGFWRDEGRPFLVAMAPLGEDPVRRSSNGTGRGDAFSIVSTSDFELEGAKRLLAHEYMHTWVADELGAMPEKDEGVDYWFSEGFNDFLASKVLLGSGLWTLSEFVADKNETLSRYTLSPVRNAAAREVAEKFWSNGDYMQLSYDRGHLMASIFDAQIRSASAQKLGLGDVLRAQRKAFAAKPALASDLFPVVLKKTVGLDASEDIRRYAVEGETVRFPPNAFGECAKVVTERRAEFTRGFDGEATAAAGGLITGVDAEGPAYRAGIRNGMRLLRRESGKIGDSTVEIAYRIADQSGERVVRYMPAGAREFDVQKIVLTVSGGAQEARCRALLGS
jgi:predicted metalloprotease with PDZ domain